MAYNSKKFTVMIEIYLTNFAKFYNQKKKIKKKKIKTFFFSSKNLKTDKQTKQKKSRKRIAGNEYRQTDRQTQMKDLWKWCHMDSLTNIQANSQRHNQS